MALADFINQETLAEQPNPVRGTGGGLSDMVGAAVTDDQGAPQGAAQISEGEFVMPADVVSRLGDGSSEAGARILTKIIEQIRGDQKGQQQGPVTDLLK